MKLTTILLLGALATSCSTNQPPQDEAVDRFSFTAKTDTSYDCTECPPTIIDMCSLAPNGDVLAFVEVKASDYVVDVCEDRPYQSNHTEQTLKILGVAVGALNSAEIKTIAVDTNGVATEVGDFAIVGLRKLDGVWFTFGRVPIEMVADDSVPVDQQRSSDQRIEYDLPTNFEDFQQEAQIVHADYEAACGASKPAGRKTDDELRGSLYSKDCPPDPVPDVSNEGDYDEADSP